MKNGSTIILKTASVLFAAAVFVFCILIIRILFTEVVGGYHPILIGMLIAAAPFFIGVYETLKLLNLIDHKKAFTTSTINTLSKIKYCGVTISTIYGLGVPYIFIVADHDDAPGVVLIGLIFTFAPMAIAIFAQLLQQVLKDAMNLKSENDLTV